MSSKSERRGFNLDRKSFTGKDGRSYLVFRTTTGSYHAFVEVEGRDPSRPSSGHYAPLARGGRNGVVTARGPEFD
jgi:hypothetical protein